MSNIASRSVRTKFKMPQIKLSPRIPKKLQLFLIMWAKDVGTIFGVIGIGIAAVVLWALPFAILIWGVLLLASTSPHYAGGGWWLLAALIFSLFWYPLAFRVTKWFNYEHGRSRERWY